MGSLKAKRTIGGALVFGRGLLSAQLKGQTKGFGKAVIVAAGVSDSSELQFSAFLREQILLTKALRLGRPVIYFGSLGAEPLSEVRYYRHKYRAERRIIRASKRNWVFCLPQVFGQAGNSHTLVNYFFSKIAEGKLPPLQSNVFRLLIPVSYIPHLSAAFSNSSLGRRVSVLHNAALTPGHLLAILKSEYTGSAVMAPRDSPFARAFALRRSEREKGRRAYVLRLVNLERLESELRAYVRAKKFDPRLNHSRL